MDENLHNDKLESFFQKSFGAQEEGQAPDGWDVPGDEVWAGIDQGLEESSIRPSVIPWRKYALAASLLIGILWIGIQAYTNYQLKQQLAAQTEQIETLQEKIQLLEAKQQLESLNHQVQEQTTTKNNQLETGGKQSRLTTSTQVVTPQISTPHAKEKVMAQRESKITFNSLPINDKMEKPQTEDLSRISSTNKTAVYFNNIEQVGIAMLHSNLALLSLPYGKVHFLQSPNLATQTSKHGLHFFAGLYVAPNQSGNRVMQRRPDATLFRKNETYQWSAERGIKLGLELSPHWRLNTGISFYDIRLQSRQLFRLEYNPETETRIDDEYESVYALSIPSSYGTSDVALEIRRPAAQNIPVGQRLLVDVKSQQELKFVSIPLVAGYHANRGRFSFGLKAGLALNILNTKTFSSTAEARLSFLRLNGVRLQRAYDETQSLTMDYLLGATLAYHLTPQWSLTLEPTFRKNITPITETQGFRTNNQAVGLQLGTYYRF